jgi:hypothetical protein
MLGRRQVGSHYESDSNGARAHTVVRDDRVFVAKRQEPNGMLF